MQRKMQYILNVFLGEKRMSNWTEMLLTKETNFFLKTPPEQHKWT